MIKTGIFGGTFNPLHNGHIALAQWLISHHHFDEIWFVLSPSNPLKDDRPGATDDDRKEMIRLACEDLENIRPCFIEFDMPRPSYTIATLRRLTAEFPDRKFSLIIGADNWQIFSRWREYQEIINDYGVSVYPRPGYALNPPPPCGVNFLMNAPVVDVSSTEIRAGYGNNLLPEKIQNYIRAHNLYEHTKVI